MKKSLSCSLPQNTTKEKQNEKCLVFVKSVCVQSPCSVVCPVVPRSAQLSSAPRILQNPPTPVFHQFFGERCRGEWRGRRKQCLRCVLSEAPHRPAGPEPASHLVRAPQRAETDREGGDLLGQVPTAPRQSAGV